MKSSEARDQRENNPDVIDAKKKVEYKQLQE